MKIVVVGAGAVAAGLEPLLIKDKNIEEVLFLSNHKASAQEFLSLSNKKVSYKQIDVIRDTKKLITAAKGYDLLLNAASPFLNETLLKHAIRCKTNYMDLSSELADERNSEQFQYDEKLRDSNICALINAGAIPGLSNLLIGEAAHKKKWLHSVTITALENQDGAQLFFPWSVAAIVDYAAAPLLEYKNGRYSVAEPFQENGMYDFKGTIGKRRTYASYLDETTTLPKFLKIKNIYGFAGGSDIELAKSLRQLGFASKQPVKIAGKFVKPVDVFATVAPSPPGKKQLKDLLRKGLVRDAHFQANITIEDDKKKKTSKDIIFPTLQETQKHAPGINHIAFATALCAHQFIKHTNWAMRRGVIAPEALSQTERKNILKELKKSPIVIK